ncbi:MAG TPA: hypothetical protein VKB80_31175 [Kofleriaceae bacterium]|nr:hypothetical protein [Kofleriaceae bacterium]
MLYQVDIDEMPADTTPLIRALRVVGKMSLEDARGVQTYLTRAGGGTVVAGVDLAVAQHIAGELGRAGARALVVESSVRSATSCNPEAAKMFVWGAFRTLQTA